MSREDLIRWGVALGIAAGIWILGWLVRNVALTWLTRLASHTRSDLDELVLDSVRPRVASWFLLLGVAVAVRHGDPGPDNVALVDKAVVAIFLFSVTLALASLLSRLFETRAQRWSGTLPSTSLTRNAIRILVIGMGSLVVLGTLGIAIAPLLTALGVGSLAVALALQPTLSNLFAGFHITMARKIRVGDFVELEGGQQGYVEDIGWRSTQVRELPNNLILVPNAKLAEIIVKNYALPDDAGATLVQVGVAYGSDLETVERVTVETALKVQQTVTGAVEDFEPFIRYHTFGDSSIDFTVILRVKTFVDRYLVMHEFIKRLQRAYVDAGIEIPFPQRVVHLPR
jgi:small-conductance mechanosensitive channel